jgi:hypothetical protein
LQELGYQGNCLFVWHVCLYAFCTSVIRYYFLIKYFSYILMHLFFGCIVMKYFSIIFGASVFRLQLLIDFLWLLSMEKELVLQIFSIIIYKMFWSRIA